MDQAYKLAKLQQMFATCKELGKDKDDILINLSVTRIQEILTDLLGEIDPENFEQYRRPYNRTE